MKYKKVLKIFCLLLIAFPSLLVSSDLFRYKSLPNLPPSKPGLLQIGLAGSFAGLSNGKLLLAGGANFPNESPWEGGEKVYYDDVYVLQLETETEQSYWESVPSKLPFKIAYGASVQVGEEFLCIGGNDENQCSDFVYMFYWNDEYNLVYAEVVPRLPVPLTGHAAVLLDNKVYVLGGSSDLFSKDETRHFYVLDLEKRGTGEMKWEVLKSWPGKSRIFPVAVTQSNGLHNCIYLFSGRSVSEKVNILSDGFVYNPVLDKWDILDPQRLKFNVMAGNAFAIGTNNIVFLSGDDGQLMQKEIALRERIKNSNDQTIQKSIELQLIHHLENHPGFSKDIMVFNTN